MLHAVLNYARDRLPGAELGFAPQTLTWALRFAEDGRFLGEAHLGSGRGGLSLQGVPSLAPDEIKRKDAIGLPAWETAGTALLWPSAGKPANRPRHDRFVAMLRELGAAEPRFAALADAFADPEPLETMRAALQAHSQPSAKPTDTVVLMVGNDRVATDPAVKVWWRERYRVFKAGTADAASGAARSAATVRCVVTGEPVVPARTHQTKIKGLAGVGGRGMGDALVSFDKEAFTSFGLDQSHNAAMAEATTKTYAEALNHLIEHNGRTLAGTRVVFWYKDAVPPDDDFLRDLYGDAAEDETAGNDPPPPSPTAVLQAEDKARQLLDAIRAGSRPDLAGNRYHALTLSGASGRVMVRDWMEGSFEEFVDHVQAWFADLAIVRSDGLELARNPKFLGVVGALFRDLGDAPPPFVAGLWRVALTRAPIPTAALALAVARCRIAFIAKETPRLAALGLLRAFHCRSSKEPPSMAPYLNENHPEPAYHAGRLLAVLADLQYAALGDVGAGVVQRYYVAASQAPALTVGRLMNNHKNHLSKLYRDKPGVAYRLEGRLAEIFGRFGDGLPPCLDLVGQSLFALGYYQQLAHERAEIARRKAEAAARKAAGAGTAAGNEEDVPED